MESPSPYPISYVRKRVKYLRIRVKRTGEVVVSIPWLMPYKEVVRFVAEKDEWIRKTRKRFLEQGQTELPIVTKEQVDELNNYLTIAVEMWRIRMKEEPVTWKLRNMKSQWGNCRHLKRLITFNIQLARVEHDLIDYIIVHELAHLQVQNHGSRFHELVAKYIPNEKDCRFRLRMIAKGN